MTNVSIPERLVRAEFIPKGVGPVELGTSMTTIYENTTGGPVKVTNLVLGNRTGGAIAYTLEVLPDGATSGVTYRPWTAVSQAANTTSNLLASPLVLNDGETLQGLAGSANSIVVHASVEEPSR